MKIPSFVTVIALQDLAAEFATPFVTPAQLMLPPPSFVTPKTLTCAEEVLLQS